MLKITTLLILGQSNHMKSNENKLNKNSDSSIDSDKIDDKIANLSSNINKMGFKTSFFPFNTSLAFI